MKISHIFCDLCKDKVSSDSYSQYWILEHTSDVCDKCAKRLEKALKSMNFWESVKGN